jgi:hypothetical protein
VAAVFSLSCGVILDLATVVAFLKPFLFRLLFESATNRAGDRCEERLRQTLSRLAIGAGFGRARGLSLREAMSKESGDGAAAGMVCTEDLTQKNPERD